MTTDLWVANAHFAEHTLLQRGKAPKAAKEQQQQQQQQQQLIALS